MHDLSAGAARFTRDVFPAKAELFAHLASEQPMNREPGVWLVARWAKSSAFAGKTSRVKRAAPAERPCMVTPFGGSAPWG
jgi:hypothetical protein